MPYESVFVYLDALVIRESNNMIYDRDFRPGRSTFPQKGMETKGQLCGISSNSGEPGNRSVM